MRIRRLKRVIPVTLMLLLFFTIVALLRISFFEVRTAVTHATAETRKIADLWIQTQSHLLAGDQDSAARIWRRTDAGIHRLSGLRLVKALGMLDQNIDSVFAEMLEISSILSQGFSGEFSPMNKPREEYTRLTENLKYITESITDYADNQTLYFQNLLLFSVLLLSTGVFILVITEQRNLALLKAEQRARNLSRYLISDYEKSMHSIALELHDDIAQELYLVRMEYDPSRREKLLDRAITKLRHLSYDIRPGKVVSLPLTQGLRSLFNEMARKAGWKSEFVATGLGGIELPYEIRIHIYRIVQEALTNIHKHANATSVSVKVVGSYPDLKISVSDNGCGFNTEHIYTQDEDTMGLRGMRERVEIIRGHIAIHSSPEEGTRLQIKLNIEDYLHAQN